MNDLLTRIEGKAVDRPFQPERTAFEDAIQRAAIEMATRLGRWKELDEALDALVSNQIDCCNWWRDNVRRPGQGIITELLYFAEEAERITGISPMQVSRWRRALGVDAEHPGGLPERIDHYTAKVEAAARRKTGLKDAENHRAHGTGLDEWFTPQGYVEKVRAVLGTIDLDPASHAIPQQWIRAERFFTAEDDALEREWNGRVWLNPPYSRDLIGEFALKLATEIAAKRVTAAIVLTHAYTDTSWWQELAQLSPVIAFPKGRIRFVDDLGHPCNPTQGQTFFGSGAALDYNRFRDVFSALGEVRGR